MTSKSLFNLGFIKKHLNVKHLYQLSESGIPQEERDKACSPTCITMMLNYVLGSDGFKESSMDIFNKMNTIDSKLDIGWKHSTAVNIFKSYGLTSWRRNWNVSNDIAYFKQKEGYDDRQINAFYRQVNQEYKINEEMVGISTMQQKALYSICDSIAMGYPVIISVKKGFSYNGAAHQVIVSGFDYSNDEVVFKIVDPIVPSGDDSSCDLDKFFQYFNYLAIFIKR